MEDVESRQKEYEETKSFLQFLDITDETIDFKQWNGLFMLLNKIKSLDKNNLVIVIHYNRNYCGIWSKDLKEFSIEFGRNIPVGFESSELVSENNKTFTKHKDTIEEAVYAACLKFVSYYNLIKKSN